MAQWPVGPPARTCCPVAHLSPGSSLPCGSSCCYPGVWGPVSSLEVVMATRAPSWPGALPRGSSLRRARAEERRGP